MRSLLTFVCALLGAFLVLSLLSCDGEVPVDPDAAVAEAVLSAKAHPATHSVTGQATSWYEGPTGAQGWLHISLSARLQPDGSAKGNFHWQWRSRDPGGRIFVKVECLAISGSEARMVGKASQAGNPDNVGKWMGLYVKDGGEGRGAPPDLIFQRWFGTLGAEAIDFCRAPQPEDPVPRELTAGNIQVH